MNPRTKDIIERAIKTFLQAALAVLVASGTDYLKASVWQAAAIAGGAAVISFAWNLLGGSQDPQ